MQNVSNLNALVFDYGNYVPMAERLAGENGFAKVYYYCPYVFNGFPDHRPMGFGMNVPNLIKVKEWAEVINDVDIVVFCDAHEPALQVYFETIGKKVFGARYGTELEHNRARTKEIIASLELPLNPYKVANGLDELEMILMNTTDRYVKSSLRGDMESWHHKNYLISKGELQRLRKKMGVYANKETYIVEEPINSVAEIGIDTFCIAGRYPEDTMSGYEIKDTGFYGRITPYSELPRQLRTVTDKFAPIFRDLEYKGWYSNEVMISSDKKGYLIDKTCRMPQPPTDLLLTMITNFPQCVWEVACGNVPTLEYKYRHGVQLIIKSDIAKQLEPSPVLVPEEYKPFVRVKNLTVAEDGVWYYTPYAFDMCEIGSVVGVGHSMNSAIAMAKNIAESIQGFDIKINTDCMSSVNEQLQRLEKLGITAR